MSKIIARIAEIFTIIIFIATLVAWATNNKVGLIVGIVLLFLTVIYSLVYLNNKRIPLQKHEEYEPIEQFLARAEKVDIIGINLAGIVSGHQGFIEDKAKKGCEFRFILTNPSLISSVPMSEQTKKNTENTYDLLNRIMAKSSNVKLRLLQFTPTYSLLIKHRSEKSPGIVQVEIYSQIEIFSRAAMANKRPHFILTQNRNKYWYDYFCEEFEQAWNVSSPIDL